MLWTDEESLVYGLTGTNARAAEWLNQKQDQHKNLLDHLVACTFLKQGSSKGQRHAVNYSYMRHWIKYIGGYVFQPATVIK